jgi:hypothetical protein
MWVLHWLYEGNNAEGNNEEDCEDNESNQFRELKGYFLKLKRLQSR